MQIQIPEEAIVEMLIMYGEGATLQVIGDKYRLSRERIRQYFNSNPQVKAQYMEFQRIRKEANTPKEHVCENCGKTFTKRAKYEPATGHYYCGRKCFSGHITIARLEALKAKGVKDCAECRETKPLSDFFWTYRRSTDVVKLPGHYCKKCQGAHSEKWRKKHRVYLNERVKPYMRAYRQRRKQDPEFLERERIKQKEYLATLRKDPVRWEQYRIKTNENRKRSYHKLKAERKNGTKS